MATTTRSSVKCPGDCCGGRCNGETVEVRYAKTVRVMPCTVLVAQGWTGHQAAYTHNQAQRLVPA